MNSSREWSPTHARARWLVASLGLGGLFCEVVPSRSRAQAPPHVYDLDYERIGTWEGYSLNGHRITAAYVSDPIHWPDQEGFSELVEMDVSGPNHGWNVRCSFDYGTFLVFSATCDFVPDDGSTAATLVVGSDLQGHLLGDETDLRVTSDFFNTELLQLFFERSDGSRFAAWKWKGLRRGYPSELTTSSPGGEPLELTTLSVLSMLLLSSQVTTPNLTAPRSANRLDSFPVVERGPRVDRGQYAALALLERRGAATEAQLLRRHLDDSRGIDRRGGAWVERHPWTPRIAMGLHGGVSFLPDPSGTPRGIGGGSLDVVGGLRLHRLLLTLVMGLRFGVIDERSFASRVGTSAMSSAGLALAFEARYALPLGLSPLEGLLGLSAGGQLRLVDVAGWGDTGGVVQLGATLGPIVGFQIPIWKVNDLGSRLLIALEGIPEWSFWRSPSVTPPPGAEEEADRLSRALSGRELTVRAQLGLRLEL